VAVACLTRFRADALLGSNSLEESGENFSVRKSRNARTLGFAIFVLAYKRKNKNKASAPFHKRYEFDRSHIDQSQTYDVNDHGESYQR
jgi:hypothetical protein